MKTPYKFQTNNINSKDIIMIILIIQVVLKNKKIIHLTLIFLEIYQKYLLLKVKIPNNSNNKINSNKMIMTN